MIAFTLAQNGLLILPVELTGPSGSIVVQMALDTGATNVFIRPGYLEFVGYDLQKGTRTRINTASGSVEGRIIELSKITVLDRSTTKFKVVAQKFDDRLGIDGLIGLNLFRKFRKKLVIDFGEFKIGLQ